MRNCHLPPLIAAPRCHQEPILACCPIWSREKLSRPSCGDTAETKPDQEREARLWRLSSELKLLSQPSVPILTLTLPFSLPAQGPNQTVNSHPTTKMIQVWTEDTLLIRRSTLTMAGLARSTDQPQMLTWSTAVG